MLSLSWRAIEASLEREVGGASQRWRTRRAIVVRLEDASGASGRGEAAPLPGVSPETLEDVERALARLGSSFTPSEVDLRALPASLALALEAAMLELHAGDRPAYAALVDPAALARVPEALELQVLLDELERAEAHARRAFARQARAFKVKIGREGRASDEAALLERLRALGPDVTLRLDANGRPIDPDVLAPAIARARVEYLEDPGPSPGAGLAAWVGAPLAIDAPMIVDPHLALAHAARHGARVAILKPTLLGGLEPTLALAARARSRGYRVVLSHAFESPIGLATLVHLALAASAACPRALAGAQGLSPWPGVERFSYVDTREPIALPYFLSEGRALRPSSPGLGVEAPRA